ncbi:fungal-specific transcription factor domain-containing protein [Truncatella angustata]|uniref:Fungal-specific transcription factor domain-containing protein n=1 Tax=Truncatella angustata TaxID=152316 RepID=A0A9P8UW64_9PEZI|nr:fungal-specific transcription factor domain-containing protein [Truncatella angustata]KAH6659317.1 fungal-specific transcription factor domain-containing protein [Truncatella angustata]
MLEYRDIGVNKGHGQHRKQHCWECIRRYLVCDSERPGCKRCFSNGTECPGYGNAKPTKLRWLAPGQVRSRRTRAKTPLSSNKRSHDKELASNAVILASFERAAITQSNLKTDEFVLVEAMNYYNTCIHPDLLLIHELGPNPYVYPILSTHLQHGIGLPDHVRYGFICMTLSHRINRIRNDVSTQVLTEKCYQYRGLVIRSLIEDINVKHKYKSDVILAGMMALLLADAQQGALREWRSHLEAMQQVIILRGGLNSINRYKHLESLLLCFVFIAVIGDSTSPATDLFLTNSRMEEFDTALEQYNDFLFVFQMCPPFLFSEITNINRLRLQATKLEFITRNELYNKATMILARVNEFCPEKWGRTKPSRIEDWVLMASIYQLAVALYCILSLQSVSVLPSNDPLRIFCAATGHTLLSLLEEGLASRRINRFLLWPLVVLGVEAKHDNPAMRTFVAKQLPQMSRRAGVYAPLTALALLERFWASHVTGWDACFDRPYAFTLQVAVDVSRVSSAS